MKRYDVCARTGTYTDRDGNEKGRWQNCGAVFESEKGMSLKLEAIPVGSEWNGFFSLFEPRAKGTAQSSDRPPRTVSGSDNEPPPFNDDNIPF